MGNRRQQGTAQLLGFPVQTRRLQIIGQLRPGQGLGQWLAQRGQQATALAGQRLAFAGTHTE